MDTVAQVRSLLQALDGSGSDLERRAIDELRAFAGSDTPRFLLEKYRLSRGWRVRASCVYYSMFYARVSEHAVELGVEAVTDRSKAVRYRACMLLSWAQKPETLPELRSALDELPAEGAADVRAAIDAIENTNPNFFVDREHTGKLTLTIREPSV